jgi:hypothetical protein
MAKKKPESAATDTGRVDKAELNHTVATSIRGRIGFLSLSDLTEMNLGQST